MPVDPAAERILNERFGKDSLIALATFAGAFPSVRTVNACYADGSFYCVTHARSNKAREIAANANVGVAGDWFAGHGRADSLGPFAGPENRALAERLRAAFAAWIDNGHSDLDDPETIILRVRLTDAVLFSHGMRWDLAFSPPAKEEGGAF